MCFRLLTHPHSNESQHLAEGTEVARLRRQLFFCFTAGTFLPHASPSLQTGGGTCDHPTAPFARPGVCTSASYRGGNRVQETGRSKQGRGRDWSRGGNGDGNGDGGGNGDVNGHGDGDRAGGGTGTGVEVNEGAQDRNGDGSEDSSGDGNGDEDNGNGNERR